MDGRHLLDLRTAYASAIEVARVVAYNIHLKVPDCR